MVDIDLAAIRARDAKWHDRHPLQQGASRDRRMLLQYIDEIERLVEDLAIDIKLLRVNIGKMPEGESPDPQNAPNLTDPGKLST